MPRGPKGGNLSISELEGILDRRRTELSSLRKQRAKLEKELTKLDRRIGALGGGGGGRTRGGRAKNEMSLVATLEAVLGKAGKAMKVGEIVERVQQIGYRSSSDNFRGIVNQTLIKEKRFTSPERGVYELKK